ncbi:MAG: redox-sensing transcriptional repressor Rex [Muribaculaceae bacterium]|nr:redox-sensing transcriptional repressor Rex [Muribaculaceae bacterium]
MNDTKSTRTSPLLPEPTLRRLPWYLAYLSTLRQEGVANVSSRRLAEDLAVDPSQIAKDLSFINIKGKTRIGYDVAELERTLRRFLGFEKRHNALMAGAGSLGGALMRDSGLERYGLNIVAGIDSNPDIAGTDIAGIPVYSPDELSNLVKKYDISIGILAVPFEQAQAVADSMVEAGIKALWNFTPRRIRVASGVVVANTSIYAHLAVMYNRLAGINSPQS